MQPTAVQAGIGVARCETGQTEPHSEFICDETAAAAASAATLQTDPNFNSSCFTNNFSISKCVLN